MKWFLSALTAFAFAVCHSAADDFTARSKLGDFDLKMNLTTLCTEADRAAAQQWTYPENWRVEVATSACTLPANNMSPKTAREALGDETIAYTIEGDVYTLYQRFVGAGAPTTCCSLQELDWTNIEEDIFASRLRLRDLDAAILSQTGFLADGRLDRENIKRYRGKIAPQKPEPRADLKGSVEEYKRYSPSLEETRHILVYRPFYPPPKNGYPTLILADGQSLKYYARLLEPLIEAGEIEPLLIIGVRSGRPAIVEDRPDLKGDIRAMDYIPSSVPKMAETSRFDAHLDFVAETLLPWAQGEFGASTNRERIAVTGASNGGVFALHAGVQRPDIFGHAWPMSAGIGSLKAAPQDQSKGRAAFRISAGWYEAGFIHGSGITANTLRQAGYDVETEWYAAGHMTDQWELRLLDNLQAVFPGEESE